MLTMVNETYLENGSSGVSRNLFLAAVPIILFAAFLSGGLAFVMGSGLEEIFVREPRHATLPVAGDRILTESRAAAGAALRPVVTLGSAPTQALAPVKTSETGDWIRIPSLKVSVPLVLAKSMSDRDVITALASGVALYPNGVAPGTPGNTFISGHSTGGPLQGAYRFAFTHIDKLQPGDTILVDYQGTRYTYRVTGGRTIDPRAIPTLDSHGETPTISLMSCWPLWTTASRIIRDGALIAVNPLDGPDDIARNTSAHASSAVIPSV